MNRRTPAVTLADIDRGLAKAAVIIEMYGDDYWPIFERLEMEREKLVGRADRLAAAKSRIANHNTALISS